MLTAPEGNRGGIEPHFVQQEAREPADEDRAQGAADEDAEDGGHERVLGPAAVLLVLWGAGRYQAVHLVHGQRCQRGLHRGLQGHFKEIQVSPQVLVRLKRKP